MMLGMAELARMLGAAGQPGTLSTGTSPVSGPVRVFTGPVAGSSVDRELLARGCWALALATEAFRSAQAAAQARWRDSMAVRCPLMPCSPSPRLPASTSSPGCAMCSRTP